MKRQFKECKPPYHALEKVTLDTDSNIKASRNRHDSFSTQRLYNMHFTGEGASF